MLPGVTYDTLSFDGGQVRKKKSDHGTETDDLWRGSRFLIVVVVVLLALVIAAVVLAGDSSRSDDDSGASRRNPSPATAGHRI